MGDREQRDLAGELLVLAPLLAKRENDLLWGAEPRLTLRQYRLLSRVRDGGASPTEIAGEMTISLATIGESLDVLAGRGLLARVRDPVDRRRVQFSLTDAGTHAVEEADRRIAGLGDWLASQLSDPWLSADGARTLRQRLVAFMRDDS